VEGWADIEIIGNSKMIWLKADLGNPQGIPLEHHLGIVLHGGWMFLKEDPDCIRNDHGPENFALLWAIDLKSLKLCRLLKPTSVRANLNPLGSQSFCSTDAPRTIPWYCVNI
jgi:hypothetical protein